MHRVQLQGDSTREMLIKAFILSTTLDNRLCWTPCAAYLCSEGARAGIMVYHLILGKEAAVQHIPSGGPDEVGGLIPNHAGLEERGGDGGQGGESLSLPCCAERRGAQSVLWTPPSLNAS